MGGVSRGPAAGAGVGVVDAFCHGADVIGLLDDVVAGVAVVGAVCGWIAVEGAGGLEAGLVDLDLVEGLVEFGLGVLAALGGAAGGEEEKEEGR